MAQDPGRKTSLLALDDPAPVGLRNPDGTSPLLLICDHAGNAVPKALGSLGLPHSELGRHIGVDIGVLGVSERLADLLDAPLVFQRYSRLVIESNRRLGAPDSIALVSDGTSIPGNADVSAADRQARIDEIFVPYHREIVRFLDGRAARGLPAVLVSMHSFTPSLLSRPVARPCEIGVCFGPNDAFTRHVLAALDGEPDLTVGRNEPYGVNMESSYSIPLYGEELGFPYAEFEIRQDLIGHAAGQEAWAGRIARVLRRAQRSFFASGR